MHGKTNAMQTLPTAFFELFFPRFCAGCDRPLHHFEKAVCLHCVMRLPRAAGHHYRDNKLEKLFWGRADVSMVTAFLRMPRKGLTHKLVHELKYKGNKEVGKLLGRLLGDELRHQGDWKEIDLILPVPLHPKKQQQRGYNQAQEIAIGVSESMAIPYSASILKRRHYTDTQTKKSRVDRWRNVNDIFHVSEKQLRAYRHVLLVDDVITTGATIEACVHALKAKAQITVSVAAVAMPVR